MKNLSKKEFVAFIVKCFLQLLLTFVAVYGILFEVPRSVGEKCLIVGCVIVAGVITLVLTFQKLLADEKKEATIKNAEKMIRYLSDNSAPTEHIVDDISEAFSTACKDIGLGTMDVKETPDGTTVLAFKDDKSNRSGAFAVLDPKTVSRVINKAQSDNKEDMKKACKSVFREEQFLETDNDISRFITTCLGDRIFGLSSSGNFINQDDCVYCAYLKYRVRCRNNHIGSVEMETRDGRVVTLETYDFTREQYEALKGATRYEASSLLLKWFEEVGINLL